MCDDHDAAGNDLPHAEVAPASFWTTQLQEFYLITHVLYANCVDTAMYTRRLAVYEKQVQSQGSSLTRAISTAHQQSPQKKTNTIFKKTKIILQAFSLSERKALAVADMCASGFECGERE
jgi:hypothetical protein